MNLDSHSYRRFWITFIVAFVPSLFIPVWPLYYGGVMFWCAPIWAAYASIILAPEYFVLTGPVSVTHASVCYLFAKWISKNNPIGGLLRFSLKSLLAFIAVASVFIAMLSSLHHTGFVLFFLASTISVIVANYCNRDSILGLPVPKLNQHVSVALMVLCVVVVVLGIPELLRD